MKLRFLLVGVVAAILACTPGQKQVINSAIDVAGYLCIIANANLADENAVAQACQIESNLAPGIKKIIEDWKAKRDAYAREQMAAKKCPSASSDAGAPDAK